MALKDKAIRLRIDRFEKGSNYSSLKPSRALLFILSVIVVTAVAFGLRLRAVDRLPIDYDEDDYLGAAQRYALAIKSGDMRGIIEYEFNYEHPPLTKLVYGLSILGQPDAPLIPERLPTAPPASDLPRPHFEYARLTSAILGSLEVFSLALLNPLSALLLGIHTWQIKYTSQIMLEPLPALTSLLVVLCYHRARQNEKRAALWLALSALALGITAASKYVYAIVGVVILVDWLWEQFCPRRENHAKRSLPAWGQIIAWGLLAVAVFWAFDPRLWIDPLIRLRESLFFHGGYARSEQVVRAGFPAWQQLVWLAGPVPWHPGVFLATLDLYILLFAIVGFKRLWRRYRVFALWLAITGLFLLIWPTKWPQYLLTITAPLCLSAAEGVRSAIFEPLRRKARVVSGEFFPRNSWRELRRAWLWLLPGAVVLMLIAFYPMIYQAAMALTDFNTISIRDGIAGGVWREVWRGATGQAEPLDVNMWEYFDRFRRPTSTDVHYIGWRLIASLFSGGLPDLLVFDILWTALSVTIQAGLGVAVAMLLHPEGVRLKRFWRTVFILPWAIPEFVGALIWRRLLEPEKGWLAVIENSPFDALLAKFWHDPDTTLLLLLVAATWYGFPFIMLAATAGLKLIPGEVYEAAAIDGASRWMQFRHVTWPLLWPLLMPAVLIRAIFAFNQFYLFYAMQTNFPTLTFATLSYYVFSPTFGGQFAISAAINLFTVVVLVILIWWFNRISRAAEGVTYVG
ncbi:MAG: sugar ABC transporter permease [Chloroflexi bacterium]|nr:sugar ABC transporter permease [Chloroflexota bacterium]